ncbi:hypothetical protein SUDANB120_03682 [Streptomyces sp. enrichment culture]|uniref:hypothetical protein n=1 Tax=Streptomyces sp. enrichment culture TaxID=1795815 RepID=UPI003F56F5D8
MTASTMFEIQCLIRCHRLQNRFGLRRPPSTNGFPHRRHSPALYVLPPMPRP